MGFEQHNELFIEESLDILSSMETPLMELENSPGRSELVDEIFRALHTIKGSAGMFGYDEISRFTHDIESTYDFIRKGTLPPLPRNYRSYTESKGPHTRTASEPRQPL